MSKQGAFLDSSKWFFFTIIFGVGLVLGGYVTYLYTNHNNQPGSIIRISSNQTKYRYINPLLAAEMTTKLSGKDSALFLELQAMIDKSKKEGKIKSASLYFRDIEDGTWLGINEESTFAPGKLLKIPIMIAYYKMAESDPTILDQKIKFTDQLAASNGATTPSKNLHINQEYTVDELIKMMIISSDDVSANLLFDNINKDQLNEVFSDLGVNFKEDKQTEDYISLKLYSLFFRLLYNSTYLNREYSEKALELLIQTDNSRGLGSKIPKGVGVANKQGGRLLGKEYQIYDCGVFYHPTHPFILCATAQGNSLSDLYTFLGDVGGRVYSEAANH